VASKEPKILPLAVYPTYVAVFIPIAPGVICEMAIMSVNSPEVSHP
jgi:hypothetical protein